MRCRLIECFAILSLIIMSSACKKSVTNTAAAGATVYVAGNGANSALYWENGIAIVLPKQSPNNYSTASSIFVSDTDVYVAGSEYTGNINTGVAINAVYWKNGTEIMLTNLPNAQRAFANSIFVSGGDVYVAGYELTSDSVGIAVYWKNGDLVNLTPITPPYPTPPVPPVNTIGSYHLFDYAEAFSIYVSGNDVYVSGYDQFFKAAYWKNGVKTQLSDEYQISNANSIFVSGNDVYTAGWLNDSAVYWKNTTINYLQDPMPAQAYSVYVSGTDVYVAGGQDGFAQYWKNGTITNLQSGDASWANSIFVSGNNVYVAGGKTDIPQYWKNGATTNLSIQKSGQASASGIFVTNP